MHLAVLYRPRIALSAEHLAIALPTDTLRGAQLYYTLSTRSCIPTRAVRTLFRHPKSLMSHPAAHPDNFARTVLEVPLDDPTKIERNDQKKRS